LGERVKIEIFELAKVLIWLMLMGGRGQSKNSRLANDCTDELLEKMVALESGQCGQG